jgi:hypothetical protein
MAFDKLVTKNLKYYVYLLKDKTWDIFYVWKWKANRCFDHLEEIRIFQKKNPTYENFSHLEKEYWMKITSAKRKKILENGLESISIDILRHWLSSEQSLEVEASIIDYVGIENLTNLQRWHDIERSRLTSKEIEIKYWAEKLTKVNHSIILININKLFHSWMSRLEYYESTRKSWRIDLDKANSCDLVCTVYGWIIRSIFETRWKWIRCIWRDDNRCEFALSKQTVGKEDLNLNTLYQYKSLKHLYKQWSQNPIKYLT